MSAHLGLEFLIGGGTLKNDQRLSLGHSCCHIQPPLDNFRSLSGVQFMSESILYWWFYWFHVAMCRIVIPRLLPALSRGVLGQLRSHSEDPADRVQRPQTDPHTQGGALFSFQLGVITLFRLYCPTLTYISLIFKGADGVEYLMVAVDANTLMDFLENEEGDWKEEAWDSC